MFLLRSVWITINGIVDLILIIWWNYVASKLNFFFTYEEVEKGKQQERLTASERIEQLQQDRITYKVIFFCVSFILSWDLEEISRLQKDHALHIQSLQRKLQLDMDGLSMKHEDGLQEVLQQQEVKDQTILELRGKLHKSMAEIQELELKYQEVIFFFQSVFLIIYPTVKRFGKWMLQ